jgi:hypothetical protein
LGEIKHLKIGAISIPEMVTIGTTEKQNFELEKVLFD